MPSATVPFRRAVVSAVVSVVLGLLVALAAVPGPAAAAGRSHSAWLPSWVIEDAVAAVVDNADLFRTASPFWYDAASCRQVVGRPGAGDRQVVSALRGKRIGVYPTVTATGLTPRRAIRCFRDADRRRAHVRRLVEVATSRPYAGLDLDYEHLALTRDPDQARRVRGSFSVFVRDLCGALDEVGRRCSVTVMPRTSGRFSVWRGKLTPAVYDYAFLGVVADQVRVMAYDQHAEGHGPGPIAGLPWVRRVVDYVTATMPAGKVRLGVPTYGRDFSRGSSVSLLGNAARVLARRHRARPVFDAVQREATFSYRSGGVRHTVWFSNPRAVAVRTRLAKRRGLAGSVYWAAPADGHLGRSQGRLTPQARRPAGTRLGVGEVWHAGPTMATRPAPGPDQRSAPNPLGIVTLVTGPEELLNERVVLAARAAVRRADPEAESTDTIGEQLTMASLGELAAPSLFSSTRCVVVREVEETAEDVHDGLVAYATSPDPDVALVLVHSGGQKGSGLLNRLRKLPTVSEHKSQAVKGAALGQFVQAEARRHGSRLEPDAAAALVEAVGADLRALAAAADQLSHDFPGTPLTAELVGRYFSGRADVKGYQIADLAVQGDTARALEELRWALETGVGAPAITGSFASAVRGLARLAGARRGIRDSELAREAGVPEWKLRSLRAQARGWDEHGLATAVRAVARADAEVKGAGADAAYSLERMVLTIAAARLER